MVRGFLVAVAAFGWIVSSVSAFVPSSISRRHVVRLNVAHPVEDEEDLCAFVDTSPVTEFGRPLDQATIDGNKKLVHTLKSFLFDSIFQGQGVERAYARFYALETIARMPYFSYVSVLHLLETLGSWRRADYLRLHFAESWNELHHLQAMEELGGNQR